MKRAIRKNIIRAALLLLALALLLTCVPALAKGGKDKKGGDAGGLRAVARGGTAVLRVPDAWIEKQELFDAFGTAGDERFEGDAALKELARILHGDAYDAFAEAVWRDGYAEGYALCPSIYPEEGLIEMHGRHISEAWYLTFRPGAADRKRMKKKDKLKIGLRLEGGDIRWENDALIHVSWGLRWEKDVKLSFGEIDGKPAFSGDFENLNATLFREMDANILVVRESPGDENALAASLTLDDLAAAEGLTGYMDGGDAVYVGVLSDFEAEALKKGAFPRLVHPESAPEDNEWARDYAAEGLPAPGNDLSFLADYEDAARVGDWYLACAKATEPEERHDSATRNTTAKWTLLDEKGGMLADGLYWWPEGNDWPIHPRPFEGFEDGVDTAVLRVGQKYGLIDRSGRIAVKPQYDEIFGFEPGDTSTPVEKDGKWGAIDESGNVVVPVRYDFSFIRFEGGCATAQRNGKYCLLAEDGTEILPAEYDMIWLDRGSDYGMARKGGTCYLFNRAGEILFEKELGEYGFIYCYADATPPFGWTDGTVKGYCGMDGADVPGGPYEYVEPFWADAETAAVELDGRWGAVRRDGSLAALTEYQWIGKDSEGLTPAQDAEGLYGYLDAEGNVAIDFQFGDVRSFQYGYADACPVENPSLHGLIDRKGDWVIEPAYRGMGVGPDGVAVAGGWDAQAYYDVTGENAAEIEGIPWPSGGDGRVPAVEADQALKKRLSGGRLPHLDGAMRLYPLYMAVARAGYPEDVEPESWDYGEDPVLTVSGEDNPWLRLVDGDADIIFVPAPDPEDSIWATLAARGLEAEFIPLCRDAVVFPVNAENLVDNVAIEDLKRVYAGEITDWSDLGGKDLGGIVAYQSSEDGEARAVFQEVCGFENLMDAPQGIVGIDGFDMSPDLGTASYRNLPNALGYALLSDCRELLASGRVKLLSVDGVAPTAENIADGSYPYAETLYAVRLKSNDNPNVRALLDWIRSERGKELIEKAGFAGI